MWAVDGCELPLSLWGGEEGMGVGAKMAKGAVVRAQSLRPFDASYPPGPSGGRWRGIAAVGFSPSDAPIWRLGSCCVPLSSPALAHVWAGLRASWPAPGKGREGRCAGERLEVWGGGNARGESLVSGVRRITLFIPVYGLSSEGD